jgi:hypothetical protein
LGRLRIGGATHLGEGVGWYTYQSWGEAFLNHAVAVGVSPQDIHYKILTAKILIMDGLLELGGATVGSFSGCHFSIHTSILLVGG